MRPLLLTLPLLASTSSLTAAVADWNVNFGDWRDEANWDPQVIPDQNTIANIDLGTAEVKNGALADRVYLGANSGGIGGLNIKGGAFMRIKGFEVGKVTGTLGTWVIDGGTLDNNFSPSVAGDFKIGGLGRGMLTIRNGGKLTLNFLGVVTIASGVNSEGTLSIGNPGLNSTGGTLDVDAIHFGAGEGDLQFNQTDTFTMGVPVDGPGAVLQRGSGTTVVLSNLTHTGGTTITGGTLQIGNGGTTGNISGTITNNATLAFNRSDDVNYNAAIGGKVVQKGSGTLFLNAANSMAGVTANAGTLDLANTGNNVTGTSATAPATIDGGNLTNRGGISGVAGVTNTFEGSAGGTALVQGGSGQLVNTFTGSITGGAGGDAIIISSGFNGIGGAGGTGAILNASANVTNSHNISGGKGGDVLGSALVASGGAGGTALVMAGGGHLGNGGTIQGGAAGLGNIPQVIGGTGLQITAGGSVSNGGLISGGLNPIGTYAQGIAAAGGDVAFTNLSGGTVMGGVQLASTNNQVTLFPGSRILQGPLLIGGGTLVLDGDASDSLTAAAPWGIAFPGMLVKQGAGTWTINQAMNYSGTTVVHRGTLSVQQAFFNDSSIIQIDEIGTLNLAHNATDTVAYLVLGPGSEQQRPGLWGGMESAATYKTPRITGTGMLLVTEGPVPDPYGPWAEQFGLNPSSDGAPEADTDGDGQVNRVEFLLGGSPVDGGKNARIYALAADSAADGDSEAELVLTIAVPMGTSAFDSAPSPAANYGDYSITVEGGTSPDDFSGTVLPISPVTTSLPPAPEGYEYRSFCLEGSNGLSGNGFMRVQVSGPGS